MQIVNECSVWWAVTHSNASCMATASSASDSKVTPVEDDRIVRNLASHDNSCAIILGTRYGFKLSSHHAQGFILATLQLLHVIFVIFVVVIIQVIHSRRAPGYFTLSVARLHQQQARR